MWRKQARWVMSFLVLWAVLTRDATTAAQEVTINSLVVNGASTILNITVDVIEYRQGPETTDTPVQHTWRTKCRCSRSNASP